MHIVEKDKNLGYARGFNAGLKCAVARGAEYFLIMNKDTVIDRGALAALVETAQACPNVGFIVEKIYIL